jgi:GT2 family glycosyltransferase
MMESHFPFVIIVKNQQNQGFARANNQGLAIAKGRYFLLLNSDTIVLPAAFDILIQRADNNPELGVLGPQILNLDGTVQKSWASFPSFFSELIGQNIRRRKQVVGFPNAYEVDWITGACMLVRSRTVADVGVLDDGYFMYSEETDWCFRIKKKGWKIWYISDAEIYHLGGGSAKRTSLIQLSLLYQNKIRYFNKFYGPNQATLLRYGLALAYFMGLIRRILLFSRRNREEYLDRIRVQSMLIWCLLQNKYPEVQS